MEAIGNEMVDLDDSAVLAVRSDLSRNAIRDAATNHLASADLVEREAGSRLNALVDTALVMLVIRGAEAAIISIGAWDCRIEAVETGLLDRNGNPILCEEPGNPLGDSGPPTPAVFRRRSKPLSIADRSPPLLSQGSDNFWVN